MRLRAWLLALDVLAGLGLYGSQPYLWAVSRASDCVDWEGP